MEVEFSTFCTAYDYGKILIVNNERIIERLNSKYSNGCASNGNIILWLNLFLKKTNSS